MPSYYDSTKEKPGKAKLKYQKGGVLGKAYKGNPKILSEEERREFLDRQKEAQRRKSPIVRGEVKVRKLTDQPSQEGGLGKALKKGIGKGISALGKIPGKKRAASKTGKALGQVSEKEFRLLQKQRAASKTGGGVLGGALKKGIGAVGKIPRRKAAKALGQVSEKEFRLLQKQRDASKTGKALGQISEKELKLLMKGGMAKGGKVKKMKGGGTVARGSGAARPQAFHKNG